MTSIIAFFPCAPALGTTSLVYHLAPIYASRGVALLTADFDPMASLLGRYFARLGGVEISRGLAAGIEWGVRPQLAEAMDHVDMVLGVPRHVVHEDPQALRELLQRVASARAAEVVLIDLAAGQHALNRVALRAADHVVVTWSPDDLIARMGLDELLEWHREAPLPIAGYLTPEGTRLEPGAGLHRIAALRSYPSIAAMAREARKPMFQLTPGDGALGSHLAAAGQAYDDFAALADRIAAATWRPTAPAAVTSAG